VTLREFFALATCYAGSTGRSRPIAVLRFVATDEFLQLQDDIVDTLAEQPFPLHEHSVRINAANPSTTLPTGQGYA
jgi:hypothetical protein